MKRFVLGCFAIAIVIIGLFSANALYLKNHEKRFQYPNEDPVPVYKSSSESFYATGSVNPKFYLPDSPRQVTAEPSSPTKPTKILLDVPFTPQAPFANWDEVHEQTCEEAAALMAVYALDGKELNPQLAEDELLKLVDWQKAKFGYYEDTNAAQTAQIITDYYAKKADIVYDFTLDDIKQALVDKKPVIVLAAGRLLGNPFYKQPGPIYHALVIRGFDGDTLITNDPGTRRGERYIYKSSSVFNAAHEWIGDPERITEGRRAMITVYDNE